MGQFIMIACPVCGMGRVLEKKGSVAIARGRPLDHGLKGRIRFDHMDLDSALIVQVRERRSGPENRKGRGGGGGFAIVDGMTLKAMKENPEYEDLVTQLKGKLHEILEILQ